MRRCIVLVLILICTGLLLGAPTSAQDIGAEATLILHNGIVVPMTDRALQHEAIAIVGDRILALGSDEDILEMAAPDAQIVDLHGCAVYPGFIDPHTHLFNLASSRGMTLDETQQLALENGITTAANMHTAPDSGNSWGIDKFITYAHAGRMRFRMHLYLIHTSSCGDIEGFWYEEYEPKSEIAPRLFMGGVKVFIERSSCPGGVMFNFTDELRMSLPPAGRERWENAWLIHSESELTEILERVNSRGYQAAIHAIGDLAIETCLNAYESVLESEPNTLRHMILHNMFLRDEMLPRYSELGIVALIEMTSPQSLEYFVPLVGEENLRYFCRWADLVATGAHVALDSDWPAYPISPIDKIRSFAFGDNTDPDTESLGPCSHRVSQTLSVWQVLRMMTVESAYALGVENELGTLEPGKLADLAILSHDPLQASSDEVRNSHVAATYVGGKLEYSDRSIIPTLPAQADTSVRPYAFVAGLDSDLPNGSGTGSATLLTAAELDGALGGMRWVVSGSTDLTCFLSTDVPSPFTGILLTLSTSAEMDVRVVAASNCDYMSDIVITVGPEPEAFALPVSSFSAPGCPDATSASEWTGIERVVLLPEATGGELRVYDIILLGAGNR